MPDIRVMICQNDDNGKLTGEALAMDFEFNDEVFLRIESKDIFTGIKCLCDDPLDRIIVMHGMRVKHGGKKMWVGNIKWNLYLLMDYYAIGLINALSKSTEWNVTEGWQEVFEKFEKGEPISGADLDLKEDVKGIVL